MFHTLFTYRFSGASQIIGVTPSLGQFGHFGGNRVWLFDRWGEGAYIPLPFMEPGGTKFV